jgi:AraC-like DNA-binding protein
MKGQPVLPAEGPICATIFDGDLVRIGLFRCRPWHALFREDNYASRCLIVFPGSGVFITPAGGEPVVADPNVVMLYNEGQSYRRDKLSEWGDDGVFFHFAPAALIEAFRLYDPAVEERPERPFRQSHLHSDSRSYLLQYLIVRHILEQPVVDRLYVQETALQVLGGLPANKTSPQPAGRLDRRPETRRAHADVVREVKAILATRYAEGLGLTEIAGLVHTTPFHLCRIFRQQTGETIHQYRNHLRLRLALRYLLDGDGDLTTIGVGLGYDSHSHFSQAFQRAFRTPPGQLRRRPAAELSKILTA